MKTVFRIVSDYEHAAGMPKGVIEAMEKRGIDPAAGKNSALVRKLGEIIMRLREPAVSSPFYGSAGRYRWVTVWLAIGCAIALLLLVNAVRDYRFVARLLATQQVRHQIAQITAQVEQQLRRSETNTQPVQSALVSSLHEEESVKLRDADGVLLEHVGNSVVPSPFASEEEHNAFARREPLFRTVATPAGEFVTEVFAMHLPRRPPTERRPASPAMAIDPPGPRFLTLEVALPLKTADASVLAPIRRNLAINLAAALSLMATVILAAVGLQSYVKGRRLEEQMEIARQVQSKLLPDPSVQLPGVDISTVYRPSEEVGGDFYDVFANEANGFAAVIGDVSGKGLPAALLMGVIHGAVRTAGWQGAAGNHEEESRRLNHLLCERASENRFASLFWCVFETGLRSLRYVNAGHCPPFLVSRSGGALTTKRLGEGGPVLGLLPEAKYQCTTVDIMPGDLLVMYSDGLVEANSAEGEEYGEVRLGGLLRSHFDETPDRIRETLMNSWEAFSPISQVQDDLTFTIIRF